MTTMTTQDSIADTATEEDGLTLDSLDIRDAVFGDGVILTQDDQHRLVLHAVGRGGRIQLLGSFTCPAEALNRLDELGLDAEPAVAALPHRGHGAGIPVSCHNEVAEIVRG